MTRSKPNKCSAGLLRWFSTVAALAAAGYPQPRAPPLTVSRDQFVRPHGKCGLYLHRRWRVCLLVGLQPKRLADATAGTDPDRDRRAHRDGDAHQQSACSRGQRLDRVPGAPGHRPQGGVLGLLTRKPGPAGRSPTPSRPANPAPTSTTAARDRTCRWKWGCTARSSCGRRQRPDARCAHDHTRRPALTASTCTC